MAAAGQPEVKLWSSQAEQEVISNYADLYAIVKTTEKLERAYVRDVVLDKEYEAACAKLLAQFKTLWETQRDKVPDVQKFMAEYNMQCPMAAQRLIFSGMPATVEHLSKTSTNSTAAVATAVSQFITTMDSLHMNLVAVDELYPPLNELMQALNQVVDLPADFGGKTKVKAWITKLHNLPASHKLDDDEKRQLLFDLESSYNDFTKFLH